MSLKVVGVGEVLWDLLPAGPELGGAPANFAYHAQALGAQAGLVTRVGSDALGRDVRLRLEAMQLPAELVQVDESAPTGTVEVELSGEGMPRFTIHEHVAWDRLQATGAALRAVGEADAICFGSLAQRAEPSRGTIHRLLRESRPEALRIFHINLREHFTSQPVIEQSLRQANVLKLNDAELAVLAEMFDSRGEPEAQLEALAERFGLTAVALTSGPRGSLLYRGARWSRCGSRPVQVVDTVGAGDAFTAALAIGLLQHMDLDAIAFAANEVARHVCACAGATPPLPESLRRMFVSDSRDSA